MENHIDRTELQKQELVQNNDNVIRVIENTGHTFRNKEVELSNTIIDFVKE